MAVTSQVPPASSPTVPLTSWAREANQVWKTGKPERQVKVSVRLRRGTVGTNQPPAP